MINRKSEMKCARWLACLSLALLVGCGTTKFVDLPYNPIRQSTYESVDHWPAEGIANTAELGEPMIKRFLVAKLPAVKLDASHRHITRYRDNMLIGIEVPNGTHELSATDSSRGRFFAAKGGVRVSYNKDQKGFGTPEEYVGGVHVSAEGVVSVFWLWGEKHPATLSPASDVLFSHVVASRPPREAGFQRELVYSGMSQSTLSLLYREFDNNMARPAFSQDLKYDVAKSKTIGFKGARFEILDAGNTTITYRVLTPLQ